MKESFIQDLFAERIGGSNFGKDTTLYKFEKIKIAKRETILKFPDKELIDMGVGEPDAMADTGVINTLYDQARKWENRGYSDNGIQEFKDAAARYMRQVYGVESLNPDTEIIHAIGSKPALAMIPQAFINPGDVTLMTVPGYPVIGTMTSWLQGQVYPLPLVEENTFLPDLDSVPKDILKKAKLLYINYPNNPTGASATKEFYEKIIAFARSHNIIVVQDAAYAALTFDGEKPLSFLSVPGAKEVGIEIHSLSKAFNMTGWRLAFIAGNELVIKAFASIKDNNDSGQFKAIQHAGIYALDHYDITEKTSEKYSRRHDMLVDTLQRIGFNVTKPKASFYLYAKIPKGIKGERRFISAEDFCDYLIRTVLISAVPWDDAGNYVRFSVTFLAANIEEEKAVMDEIYKRLHSLNLEF